MRVVDARHEEPDRAPEHEHHAGDAGIPDHDDPGRAASPGLPQEGPSTARKALERFLNLPTSTITLGFLFALSLLFPAQVSKALLGFAYLYNLLAEALGNLF